MGTQYKMNVTWDVTLRDLEFIDSNSVDPTLNGLVQSAIKTTTGAPTATAGYFAPSAMIQNAVDGTLYINTGTTAAPVWATIDSTGGFPIPTLVAKNVTATLSAAEVLGGYITSTSAAAVALTTPTATAIGALIPGIARGVTVDLYIDNSAGANTITLTLDGSITAPAGAITGGNTLTVTTTHKVGLFRLYFTSTTAAVIYRIF